MSCNYLELPGLCRTQGDTHAHRFTIQDADGQPLSLLGHTIEIVVDGVMRPLGALTRVFVMPGIPVDPQNGVFEFSPSEPDSLAAPAGKFFYALVQHDPSNRRRVLGTGQYTIHPTL